MDKQPGGKAEILFFFLCVHLPEPQLFDILSCENGFRSMSCLCMAAFGWRNTMNEHACNSMSSHNGKRQLYFTDRSDSSRMESMVLVIQGVDVLWTAGESLFHLAIFSECCVVDDNSRQIYLSLS